MLRTTTYTPRAPALSDKGRWTSLGPFWWCLFACFGAAESLRVVLLCVLNFIIMYICQGVFLWGRREAPAIFQHHREFQFNIWKTILGRRIIPSLPVCVYANLTPRLHVLDSMMTIFTIVHLIYTVHDLIQPGKKMGMYISDCLGSKPNRNCSELNSCLEQKIKPTSMRPKSSFTHNQAARPHSYYHWAVMLTNGVDELGDHLVLTIWATLLTHFGCLPLELRWSC